MKDKLKKKNLVSAIVLFFVDATLFALEGILLPLFEMKAEKMAMAQAEAIKAAGARYTMPSTLIVTPEFSNTMGLTDLMKNNTPTR